jgi:predicted Rossmann fold nucleotide-binding protein DprA/Smf involved in DNA uptake
MTEVALEFRRSFGREGRRLLEQLERGATLEVVAQVLALELSELKPWLGRLEQEGLVRRVEA